MAFSMMSLRRDSLPAPARARARPLLAGLTPLVLPRRFFLVSTVTNGTVFEDIAINSTGTKLYGLDVNGSTGVGTLQLMDPATGTTYRDLATGTRHGER